MNIKKIKENNNNQNFTDLSKINCDLRNNYDKDYCENLNPNKIENFLKPYVNYPFGNNYDLKNNKVFFDKNKFLLEGQIETVKNISKEICANKAINNKYNGFKYKGDKNKCFLYDNVNVNDFNNNIEDKYKDYNRETLFKTRNTIDIKKYEDQQNSASYFEKVNTHGFIAKDKLDELNVSSKDECMDSCIKDYENCKSIVYLEQPKECTFFKDKKMVNKKDKNINKDYDIYSLKRQTLTEQNNIYNNLANDFTKNNELLDKNNDYYCKLSNNKCYDDYKISSNIEEENKNDNNINNPNLVTYNCSGIYSTNPFCTNEFNMNNSNSKNVNNINDKIDNKYTKCVFLKENSNLNDMINTYNNECKKEFGQEYIFDNDEYNTESVVECGNNNGNIGKNIKCKLNFDNSNLNIRALTNPFQESTKIEKFSNLEINNKMVIIDNIYLEKSYRNLTYTNLLIFAIFWVLFLLFLFRNT
jgi:hypothetical protein